MVATARIIIKHGSFHRIRLVVTVPCTSLGRPSPNSKRHLNPFSRFCGAHVHHQNTDKETDHATCSNSLYLCVESMRCQPIIQYML